MKFKNNVWVFLLLAGVAQANVLPDSNTALSAVFFGSAGNVEKDLAVVEKKVGTIGFSPVSVNTHLEGHYYHKYKEKNVEMISFYGMTNLGMMRELLLANPDFGAYATFNFLAYKTLDVAKDDYTWYGHLSSDTMLNIIGEKDSGHRKTFTDMFSKWDTLVKQEMKPTRAKLFEQLKPLPSDGLTKMVLKFEKSKDIEDFMDEFVGDYDGRFAKANFVIAGFIDYKFEYDDRDEEFEKYDAYWASLLCHFEFSNSIFNHGKPEAAMMAPCSVYFYVPKGTNELHVGYANVGNWTSALSFKDEKRIAFMKSIDAKIVGILKGMGFK